MLFTLEGGLPGQNSTPCEDMDLLRHWKESRILRANSQGHKNWSIGLNITEIKTNEQHIDEGAFSAGVQ